MILTAKFYASACQSNFWDKNISSNKKDDLEHVSRKTCLDKKIFYIKLRKTLSTKKTKNQNKHDLKYMHVSTVTLQNERHFNKCSFYF